MSNPKDLAYSDPYIPVRMLTQYTYCPRLAYMEWVQGEWHENADTVEGTIVHRRVDRPEGSLSKEMDQDYDKLIRSRSVSMSSDAYGITAKIDLVEQSSDQVVPIEYKKAACPASGPFLSDKIQVAAQALILRDNGFAVNHGAIYYAGSRRRVDIEFSDDIIYETLQAIEDLRGVSESQTPPPVLVDSPKCERCSLARVCLPDETNLLKQMEQDETASQDSHKIRRLVPALNAAQPLYLTQPGTSLGKAGARLQVKDRGEVLTEVRLNEVDHVSVFGNIQISTQALQALMESGSPVTYFSGGGWFYGYSMGTLHKNVLLRRAQYRAADDSLQALTIAQNIIFGKISNCRTLLRRNGKGLPRDTLGTLKSLSQQTKECKSLSQLVGVEGVAARIYFEQFPRLVKQDVPFDWTGRNRRPPKDPVNALLSLGYALLTKQMTITLNAIGFDPFMGFLHQPKYGKPALALDLIEEFRPLVVDSVAITTINTGELTQSDFTLRNGAANLTTTGRRTFIRAFERRLDTEVVHPLFGYRVSYRRVLELQGRLLARLLLGDIAEYPSFRTR